MRISVCVLTVWLDLRRRVRCGSLRHPRDHPQVPHSKTKGLVSDVRVRQVEVTSVPPVRAPTIAQNPQSSGVVVADDGNSVASKEFFRGLWEGDDSVVSHLGGHEGPEEFDAKDNGIPTCQCCLD